MCFLCFFQLCTCQKSLALAAIYHCLDTWKYSTHLMDPWIRNVAAQVAGDLKTVTYAICLWENRCTYLKKREEYEKRVDPAWLQCLRCVKRICFTDTDRLFLLLLLFLSFESWMHSFKGTGWVQEKLLMVFTKVLYSMNRPTEGLILQSQVFFCIS